MTTLIANTRIARIDVPDVTRARMESRQWFRVWRLRVDSFDKRRPDGLEWRITDAVTRGLPSTALAPVVLTLCDLSYEPHETIEVECHTFPTLIAAVRYADTHTLEVSN